MAGKLREQTGYGGDVFIQRRRASATQTHAPASPHSAGHDAGIHPEDAPYVTQDRHRRAIQSQDEDEDDIYPQRPPTSARRYIQPKEYEIAMSDGSFLQVTEQELSTLPEDYQRAAQLIESKPAVTALVKRRRQPNPKRPVQDDTVYEMPPARPRQEVYTQGNRNIVVHREPPPKGRRIHWMFFAGLAIFVMVVGWVALSAFGYWWQQQDNWKYGNPRTFQVNQFVGHGDTPDHPDHFIAINTGGMIEVIEMNVINPKYDHVYPITTAIDPSIPVALSFQDMNHDSKTDMLVTIGDGNPYTVILLNNGAQFSK